MTTSPCVIWSESLGSNDVSRVAGKNASLGGDGVQSGQRVPPGFATTADAYSRYVEANGLRTTISTSLAALGSGHSLPR
jgi:pyruvate,water dikinase